MRALRSIASRFENAPVVLFESPGYKIPVVDLTITHRVVSKEADALEDEFRDLVHGLDLLEGCGQPDCAKCRSVQIRN